MLLSLWIQGVLGQRTRFFYIFFHNLLWHDGIQMPKNDEAKSYDTSFLRLFPIFSWILCHSLHRASVETRKKSWLKYVRGFMRECRGESWWELYWKHWGIIIVICTVTFYSMIRIVNLIWKCSVTASTGMCVFLCLVYCSAWTRLG